MTNIEVGESIALTASPVTSNTTYAAKDCIGGKLTFNTAGRLRRGVINAVTIACDDDNSLQMDLVLFDSDPSGTTFTDDAALDIADADLDKICGVIELNSWYSFNDNSVGHKSALGIPYNADDDVIYGALVARAAVVLTGTDVLKIKLGVLSD